MTDPSRLRRISEADARLIDNWVDATMDDEARIDFERRLESDPALRGEVEARQLIDERVRSIFNPPSPDRVCAAVDEAAHRMSADDATADRITFRQPGIWRRGLAVAAALTLAAIGVVFGWRAINPAPDPYQPRPFQTLGEAYVSAQVEWRCDPGPDFYRQYFVRYGEGLLIPEELPQDVVTLGFGYTHSLSEDTIYLLAEVSGEKTVVFTDAADRSGAAALQHDEGLNLFERHLDGLVLYELTPHDEPRLLEFFYIPDPVPDHWIPGGRRRR